MRDPLLKKLEFPSLKDTLCQIWLKLFQWFLRRIFLKFVNVFSQFLYYLPLEKEGALHLNKLESPLPKNALCQVELKLAQCFWRRRWKFEKFTTTTTMTTTTMTHNGHILIRKAHLSLRLWWAKTPRFRVEWMHLLNKRSLHLCSQIYTAVLAHSELLC